MNDPSAYLWPVLEAGKTVYFVYDLTAARLAYVSPSFAHLAGEPPAPGDEALARLLQRLHPDDLAYLRRRLAEASAGELMQDLELRLLRGDGGVQWLCLTAGYVPGPAGAVLLSGHVTDITRTQEVAVMAQQFNAKKNATLEILSHELATPLVLLQQLTDSLRDEVQEQVSDDARKLLRLMERICRQGVDLIRNFVDTEFLESASVHMKWERTDLGHWLQTLLEEYQYMQPMMQLGFDLDLPPHAVYVQLDVNKFQQAVNNLISNAIKFTGDGGRITVRLEEQGGRARLTVTDTGIGIPQALQPVLFDKFTKARRPGLRGEKTTGLGMSVIRTIVLLHHGQIWFDSEEGRGTTFYVELPVV